MARSDIALDSNLLLLLAVGLASRHFVPVHRALRAYTIGDFDLLTDMVKPPARLVLLPNTLTEVSNLLDRAGSPMHVPRINATLAALARRFGERYLPSAELLRSPHIDALGMSDVALLGVAMTGSRLLTADAALYVTALRLRIDAINFNHHREASWH